MKTILTTDTPIGSYAPDFELPGIDGQVHHLSRYLEKFRAVGVVSMCNHCPYVGYYLERLKLIQQEFSSLGFTLIGVNGKAVNQDLVENFDSMKAFAYKHELNFPYLWDSTQDVTRSLGAVVTPMAFLIDFEGKVRYRGQIDDNPENPEAVQVQYLRNATASLFANNNIDITDTEPIGTAIIWRN
ncbi:alkyl hydroperoxide reductase/ thiol specific antioxidant/ Mal allergen [Calothrix sp. NIES-4071]|nr:alkyl hydroperoxide reductase/ thiol specific antioxidant/ Mal allergen [Calothrix sp. NIES-4071]BAZ63609.1 alkyl hydroperoxide reductase/ thiol specific antioxidant/ Mal allergen [Calothrix sp. NIES-4105]